MRKILVVLLAVSLAFAMTPNTYAYGEEPSADAEIIVEPEGAAETSEDEGIAQTADEKIGHIADEGESATSEDSPEALRESSPDTLGEFPSSGFEKKSILGIKPLAGPSSSGNVQNRINQLKTLYPDGSYFSANKKACTHQGGTCSNCQLSYVMKSMGYPGLQGIWDSWTCVAFAKYAFWYIFGVADNTPAYSGNVPNGAGKISLDKAKPGDLVVLNGHYGIYLGTEGDRVSLLDANSGVTNRVCHNTTYFSKSSVKYVLRANNYGSIESEGVLDEGIALRLAGADRYKTMTAILQKGFAEGSTDTVIIATGENYPDALAASGLAGLSKAPIILTSKASLTSEARSEIQRIGAKKAIIIGSSAAVSAAVEDALKSMGLALSRVEGATRIETSVEIYKAGSGWAKTAIIASGSSFADALSISSYSYAQKIPLFLTDGNKMLTEETISALHSGGFVNIIIVGSDAAVSDQVETQLKGYNITRLGGANRYETSLKIAQYVVKRGLAVNNMAVATGENFPDALTGAALCGKNNTVIMLVADNTDAKGYAETFLSAHKKAIKQIYVLGSEVVVSSSLVKYLNDCCK